MQKLPVIKLKSSSEAKRRKDETTTECSRRVTLCNRKHFVDLKLLTLE